MKVISIVTRYSSILPFFTLAFSSITCRPVIPRKVLLARIRPSCTASWKLVVEAAVIFDTLATDIFASLIGRWPSGPQQATLYGAKSLPALPAALDAAFLAEFRRS